jgi:dipeptidyl aminopeptidase/acylaminoacyl peptidase
MNNKRKGTMLNEYLTYPKMFYALWHNRNVNGELFRYGEEKEQYFTLHIPKNSIKKTLVIYIHGGGWQHGSPKQFAVAGDFFAECGFATVMLGYRKAPKYKYPYQIDDLCYALQKSIVELKQKGVLVDKAVAIGSSAGGHLGALLCLNKMFHKKYDIKTEMFQGFCSLSGILSFNDCLPNNNFKYLLNCFIKGHTDYDIANPINCISPRENMDLLLLHGNKDPLVYVENADVFYNKFEPAQGFTKQFRIIENKYHTDVAVELFYYDNEERKILLEWLKHFD